MSFHKERIEKLLKELSYEFARGIETREIDEEFGYQFMYPYRGTDDVMRLRVELQRLPFGLAASAPCHDKVNIFRIIEGGKK